MAEAVTASEMAIMHHRALGGLHAGLAHHRDAVRDGLDAGVGAAAERVGAGEQVQRAPDPERRGCAVPRLCLTSPRHAARRRCRCSTNSATNMIAWVRRKSPKIGAIVVTDSFTPRRFRTRRSREARERDADLPLVPRRREEAADGVGARGERDRDRQDVVDEQRRAGEHADRLAEELARDRVAAAARRETAR